MRSDFEASFLDFTAPPIHDAPRRLDTLAPFVGRDLVHSGQFDFEQLPPRPPRQ